MADDTPTQNQNQNQKKSAGGDSAAPESPPERPLNETVPGGRYIVGGQTVDAEGRPLSSSG